MTREEFATLFPKKDIIYGNNVVATVKPISIKDLPHVIGTIMELIKKADDKKMSLTQLALNSIDDIMKIVPYSINVDIDVLPSILLPDIIKAIIDLNLNDTVLKNWFALFEFMNKKLPAKGEQGKVNQIAGKQ